MRRGPFDRLIEAPWPRLGVAAVGVALMGVLWCAAAPAVAADDAKAAGGAAKTGEHIYQQRCAACHGKQGEGVKDQFTEPLTGKRSPESLGKYIDKWMPEDAPKKVVGDDAQKVAKYIYDAFYSPAAQARLNPPRVELSRLTANQYRNSVADLIASFGEPGVWDEHRGLMARYFNDGRRLREDRAVMKRVEPVVDADWGEGSPDQRVEKNKFGASWAGGIFAADTGEYEFIIDSPNGARLWVNETDEPLIEAMVRSGQREPLRARVFLLGGRVYPIKLEVYKLEKDPRASVTLRWKPPGRAEQIVPTSVLSPNRFAPTLVVTTPFPPDDRSMGYERATSVSKEWDEATTYAALEAAGYVASHLRNLAEASPESRDAREKLPDFCRRFVERAFRRPLTDEQKKYYIDRFFEGDGDPETAVKKVVLLALKSPRFLYHGVSGDGPDPYTIASRISFALWDSWPDRELLEAARQGRFDTREGVAREVERMMADLRTRAKIRDFFHQWLQLDRLHELTKDDDRYPQFDEAVVSDLWTSLDLLLSDVTWSEKSDFRRLMLADEVYLNGRLAAFYGADLPSDAPFQKVSLKQQQHAGVLSHPLLMAGFAYDSTSSPIHRGVFVARSLLGKRLRPPPEAQFPVSPELHPDMTTRQRIAMQTRAEACMSCHSTINPLGFTLENFDAVGRFREQEGDKPIDATGQYHTPDGEVVKFKGARQLGEFLAASPEAHHAFIERLFQHMVKQPVLAYGADRQEKLYAAFVKKEYSIKELMTEIVTAAAMMDDRRKQAAE